MTLLRRASFWPPSMVSHQYTNITNYISSWSIGRKEISASLTQKPTTPWLDHTLTRSWILLAKDSVLPKTQGRHWRQMYLRWMCCSSLSVLVKYFLVKYLSGFSCRWLADFIFVHFHFLSHSCATGRMHVTSFLSILFYV